MTDKSYVINRIIIFSTVAFFVSLGIKLRLNSPQKVEEIAEVKEIMRDKKLVSQRRTKRNPASTSQKFVEAPSVRNSQKDNSLYQDKREAIVEPEAVDETPVVNSGSRYFTQESAGPSRTYRDATTSKGRSRSNSNSNSNSATAVTAQSQIPILQPKGGPVCPGDPSCNPVSDSPDGSSDNFGEDSSETINCSANVGSGSYSYAFDVSLSCSTASTIKYCLSENTCCDPESSGIIYTGPVHVNPGAGSYCFSFVGISKTSGTVSGTVEKSYTFNPNLPDLQVAHTKRFFQTTELEGLMSLTSADFGTPGFYAGVINLKDHDPGTGDLNWNCNQIFQDHNTLSAPVTSMAMPDTDVSIYAPSSQLEVSLRTTNLVYGNNHLSTYVQNATFTEPVIACSTTNIILEDFPFFDPLPYHGVTGTNEVREFSGGFTHLGFFEPEITLFRGPAGSGSETVSSQELESNLFGIFH